MRRGRGYSHQQDFRSDHQDAAVPASLRQRRPRLRRYARAVTGSQKRGDEWVRLCAEVALQQPDLIAGIEDTKLGVFTLFHRLRQPFGNLDGDGGQDSVSGRLKEALTDMAPLQGQGLLLTGAEGFTVDDA